MKYFMLVSILAFMSCTLSSCKGTKVKEPEYKENQFQLHLQQQVKPQRIRIGFEAYGLAYLCQLDQVENWAVFQFDTALISRTEVISKMGNEVGVISAEKTLGCKKM